MDLVTVLAGVMILLGLIGVVFPLLPGLFLTWAGVAVWTLSRNDGAGWSVLAAATAVAVLGMVIKYVVPGRRLREAGVPWTTLALAAVAATVGFFVIPVIGLPVGFVLGVFLAELARLNATELAWQSTKHALVAAGWSIVIELCTALLIAVGWVIAVIVA